QHPSVRSVVEQYRRVEQEAVDAVEHATMAGNEMAGVLGADAPLDRRLDEIPDLPDNSQQGAHDNGVPAGQPGEKPYLADHGGGDGHTELSRGPLDSLSGTDDRRQRMATDRRAHEIRRGFTKPRDPDQEQYPFLPERELPEPETIPQEPVHVADPEHCDNQRL